MPRPPGSTPPRLVALLALLVLVAAVASPAAGAAGSPPTLRAGPQATGGSSVVVSSVDLPHPGFIVVQRVSNGSAGTVVGVSGLLAAGTHVGVEVPVHLDLRPGGNTTLQASAHIDDGNGRYDGAPRDPVVVARGVPATVTFPVAAGDAPVAVAAGDQVVSSGTLVVGRAALGDDGFVVARASGTDGAPGPVVGASDLLAGGTYENLSMAVDTAKLPSDGTNLTLWLQVFRSNGDGAFTLAGDPPATAAGEAVAVRIKVSTVVPALTVNDQVGNGTAVTIPRAAAAAPTWLVVNPQRPGGGPDVGRVLAVALLEPGVHRNLTVRLSPPVSGGSVLFASLHRDAPADGRYTGPAGNADPVLRWDGHQLVDRFTLRSAGAGQGRGVPGAGVLAALVVAGVALLRRRRGG